MVGSQMEHRRRAQPWDEVDAHFLQQELNLRRLFLETSALQHLVLPNPGAFSAQVPLASAPSSLPSPPRWSLWRRPSAAGRDAPEVAWCFASDLVGQPN